MIGSELELNQPVVRNRFSGNQVNMIELVRISEKNAGAVLLALPSGDSAAQAAYCAASAQRFGMLRFGFEPPVHVFREIALGQRLMHEGLELGGNHISVDRDRFFGVCPVSALRCTKRRFTE